MLHIIMVSIASTTVSECVVVFLCNIVLSPDLLLVRMSANEDLLINQDKSMCVLKCTVHTVCG